MKKITLFAAMAAVAMGASAQYQVDPGIDVVLAKGTCSVVPLVLNEASINAFVDAGCTVDTHAMINNDTVNFWWWNPEGWAPGDASYPGPDLNMDGYIALDVTGAGGWSGGGIAVTEAAGLSTAGFTMDTRFHFAYRATNAPASLGLEILSGDEGKGTSANFSVGNEAFNDNGTLFPKIGEWEPSGDWSAVDISFSDLKKAWPGFDLVPSANWSGNIFVILSGAVAGTSFALDAVYFYTPGASGIEGVTVDANAPAVYYNLQGVQVENPANGLYIVKQGNEAKKVLVK